EYEISVSLQRDRADAIINNGRVRTLDLRLDDDRLELFTIEPKGERQTFGGGEEADARLRVRVPVKAGERTVVATFLKDSLVQEGIIFKPRIDAVQSHFEGIGGISIAGPFKVQGPGATASREKIFICHPNGASEEQACAETIITALAHRAYRRPV